MPDGRSSAGLLLREGQETGGYRIVRLLGRGGMGEVWEAEQLNLDRSVGLKVIRDDIEAEPGFTERFRSEARLAASIDHDAVLPVYDHGTLDDGRLYLATKLVRGADLGQHLRQHGPLSVRDAVTILRPIAEALDAAHEQGLVHRDVKPSNVLLQERSDGSVRSYLADFGLAKPGGAAARHTRTGHVVGTVDYMAPEQAQGGGQLDGRVDVYAFGCLLYRAVTGQVPYPRENEAATMLAHVNDRPPVPSRAIAGVPPAVDTVVDRAMAKDPDRRARSAGQLMRWLEQELEPAATLNATGRLPAPTVRPAFVPTLLVNLVLLAVLFAGGYVIGGSL